MSTLEKLRNQYNNWASHPDHDVTDWQYEVNNNDTRLGYWAWVANRIDFKNEEDDT